MNAAKQEQARLEAENDQMSAQLSKSVFDEPLDVVLRHASEAYEVTLHCHYPNPKLDHHVFTSMFINCLGP